MLKPHTMSTSFPISDGVFSPWRRFPLSESLQADKQTACMMYYACLGCVCMFEMRMHAYS